MADVFDALRSSRSYKDAFTYDQVKETMQVERGQHFDPQLLDLLMDNFEEAVAIREAHS